MKHLRNFETTRHTLVVDALRYSLLLERKAYSSMMRALRTIERNDGGTGHPNEARALTAIGRAWEIVDIVYRVRGLVTQVAGLSQRTAEIQLFLRGTTGTENFRHVYQHLNSGISRIRDKTNPIMGVVSWVTKSLKKSITIFVGTGSEDIQVHTVAFDTQENKFAQQLLFSAGNRDIELENVHSACRRLAKFLDGWLESNHHLSEEDAQVGVIRFNIEYSV